LGGLRSPFNAIEKLELCRTLNALWKLPSDYRLDFAFQNHELRKKHQTDEQQSDSYSLKRAREIRSDLDMLTSTGGSFNIYDQARYSHPVVYNLTSKNTPEDAEEWLFNVPPTAMLMTEHGFPDPTGLQGSIADPRQPGWRRWM